MTAEPIKPLMRLGITGSSSEENRLSLRERQLRRTYRDLIQATLDVIAEQGLEHATIQRITSRAGTSRATLYAHFPKGRDEVYAQAYRTLGRWHIQRSEQLAMQHDHWTGRLCSYAQAMIELAAQRKIGLFYNVTGPRMTDMRYQGGGSQHTLDAFITELSAAQNREEIADHVDVETLAALLVGAVRETGIHTSRNPDQATRHLTAFRQLLEALTVPRQTPPKSAE